jgi:hypothetical protein
MATTAVKLGWEGILVEVILSRGQDWIATLQPPDDWPTPVWPDGSTVTAQIFLPGTKGMPADWPDPVDEWEATITDDDEVYFKVESALTDLIADKSVVRVMISYPNSPTTDDYRWLKGVVKRDD